MAITELLTTGSLCPSSPSCASGCSVRSFLPDQLLLPVRHIQHGVVDSLLRNTRGCLKQKMGVLVGQEVAADANTTKGCEEQEAAADADATKGGEEVTKRLSWISIKKSTDGELFIVLNEHLGSLLSCDNINCDCLDILTDQNIRECVAKYLVQFERKNKYDQDSINLE